MVTSDELIFLSTEELIRELDACASLANRELAHERADEIIVICLLRAADPQEEFTHWEAAEVARLYGQVEKFYA